jgi:hypothetical protein
MGTYSLEAFIERQPFVQQFVGDFDADRPNRDGSRQRATLFASLRSSRECGLLSATGINFQT